MTEVKRLKNNARLCFLLERYLYLNPNTCASKAIFTVTTFCNSHSNMYLNHTEQNRYMTNTEIIKKLEDWLRIYDSKWSAINDWSEKLCTELDNVVIKLDDEDYNKFVEDCDSA